MKKYFLLALLVWMSIDAYAQNTFEKVIDTLGFVYANCIRETFDGGYIVSGGSSYNGNDGCAAKLDSAGNIEWIKHYSGPGIEGAGPIVQTADSGYMMHGIYNLGHIWFLKLDANGDTIWTQTYIAANSSTNPISMASMDNLVYGMTGYCQPASSHPDAYFMAILPNGAVLADKIYPTQWNSEADAIDTTYDTGFAMAGALALASSATDVYLIRVNTFGDTLWTRHYDKSYADAAFTIVHTTDSGFAIAAIIQDPKETICLIKTDLNGDTLWTKEYAYFNGQYAASIDQTTDGGFIIAGKVVDTANLTAGSVYLIKTDPFGDTLWTRRYNMVFNGWAMFVKQAKDGGYMIAGISQGFPPGAVIIKTDSMGNVANSTGIAEVNNPFRFEIYPNPTAGNFTVLLKGIAQKEAVLQVFDVNGMLDDKRKIKRNITEEINLTGLSNGVYCIRITTGNNSWSKKIVFQK